MPAEHLRYAVLDLVELEPFAGNARRRDVKQLVNSIKANGLYRSLIVREQDEPERPKYTILCGHGTADALKSLGYPQARCEILACTDEEALRINVGDNRHGELAFWDEDALTVQLEQIEEMDLWEGSGWDEKSAAKYIHPVVKDEIEDEPPGYGIVVTCSSEEQQAELLERLTGEGFTCRSLIG
jgi:hypothetical protein